MANSAPTLSQSLKFWLLFGLTSFGGPAAQIATMHEQLVDQKKWVSEADYQTGLTLAAVLPGPEAHQLATYLGWRLHGIRGAAGAAILFVIPSLLLISLIAALYSVNSDLKLIPNISLFLVPVAIALIGNAAVSMARKNRVGKRASAFIALVAAILIFTPVPAGIVVITGVVLSLLIPNAAKALPAVMPAKDVRDAQIASRWSRTITLIAGFNAGVVFIATGWQSVWSDLIKFFIQAALLTFGGAYSVIAFVHDNAVENYGWLSSSDMAFGIALGETTPGPLIMVNTFVGYLATDSSGWAFGLLGAVLVTVTMFVPSFVLVLAGIGLMSRQAVFNSLRRISTYVSPILIALMFSMSADLLRSYADTSNALLGIVSTAASWVLLKKFPAPPLIVGSVVLGTVTTLLVG